MRAGRATAAAYALLLLGVALVAAPGRARAHGDLLRLASSASGGGSLVVDHDFPAVGLVSESFRGGGQVLYTGQFPSFDELELDEAPGLFALVAGTDVVFEFVSAEAGASVRITPANGGGGAVIFPGAASARIGTIPFEHNHPEWRLTLAEGVVGEYDVSFRISSPTRTGGPASPKRYQNSPVYTVTLTNLAPTATPTVTATPVPTSPPSVTPTAIRTATPTVVPTSLPSPTIVPTGTPAVIATPTPTLTPATSPTPGFPVGALENPQPASAQSGIGIASGWVCGATNVTVQFDDHPPIAAAHGTTREDTAPVCGGPDNGFGLLYNWALLGDGPHLAVARADGVELGRASFTVSTFGTTFLSGASGRFRLEPFPSAGRWVDVEWQPSSQGFVVVDRSEPPAQAAGTAAQTTGAGAATGSASVEASAGTTSRASETTSVTASPSAAPASLPPGNLENPPAAVQSGIGLISGWVCEANSVTVQLDDFAPVAAAYGTTRADTRAICGDDDNGFGLLFNWGLLGDGAHDIVVRVDGQVLRSRNFEVVTLGGSFLSGLPATPFDLVGFLPGWATSVAWQQSRQAFGIVDTTPTGSEQP